MDRAYLARSTSTRDSAWVTAFQRLCTSLSASNRIPNASRPDTLTSFLSAARRGSLPPLSSMSNLPSSSVPRQRCITTCLVIRAFHQQNARRRRTGVGHDVSEPRYPDRQRSSGLLPSTRLLAVLCHPGRDAPARVTFLRLRSRVGKPPHAVPAMGSCQHLDVVRLRRPQDHLPQVVLYRVVNAILSLVNEQKATATVSKCQGKAKQTNCSVAQTLEWHW